MIVNHRYIEEGLYMPENATSLLIGTFPSILIQRAKAAHKPREREVNFYYGGADNLLWPDLEAIYKRPLRYDWSAEAVAERKQLLADLKMGITDIILSCETEGGAADSVLTVRQVNEGIFKLLDDNPSIHTLYFTSGSGTIAAASLTMRLLWESKRATKIAVKQKTAPVIRTFLYHNSEGITRPMQSITLYSPSPLARRAGITEEKRRTQYAQYLPALVREKS